ncbi:amino-acid N-acetyltransferase [Methylophilaceae bacterium]|nr:amino-acid N-acetyltransferase [Methylophilaceae bacterium]
MVEIREVGWQEAGDELSAIRSTVFIIEQHVPAALEWDGLDQEARHLLAVDEAGHAVGCARVLAGGAIGRMAVLRKWRRRGVGTKLLKAAVALCIARQWHEITLSAQDHAIPFYEKAGFEVCSETYLDAGIPHRDMRLTRKPVNP